MVSVGLRGGQAAPPNGFSIFVGLVKPLVDEGDSGTPLTADVVEGDLERRSEVRRSCGVAPVYKSRVLRGDPGCGKADDRFGGASPVEGFLSG
jgi:hypothetical protein